MLPMCVCVFACGVFSWICDKPDWFLCMRIAVAAMLNICRIMICGAVYSSHSHITIRVRYDENTTRTIAHNSGMIYLLCLGRLLLMMGLFGVIGLFACTNFAMKNIWQWVWCGVWMFVWLLLMLFESKLSMGNCAVYHGTAARILWRRMRSGELYSRAKMSNNNIIIRRVIAACRKYGRRWWLVVCPR